MKALLILFCMLMGVFVYVFVTTIAAAPIPPPGCENVATVRAGIHRELDDIVRFNQPKESWSTDTTDEFLRLREQLQKLQFYCGGER